MISRFICPFTNNFQAPTNFQTVGLTGDILLSIRQACLLLCGVLGPLKDANIKQESFKCRTMAGTHAKKGKHSSIQEPAVGPLIWLEEVSIPKAGTLELRPAKQMRERSVSNRAIMPGLCNEKGMEDWKYQDSKKAGGENRKVAYDCMAGEKAGPESPWLH